MQTHKDFITLTQLASLCNTSKQLIRYYMITRDIYAFTSEWLDGVNRLIFPKTEGLKIYNLLAERKNEQNTRLTRQT